MGLALEVLNLVVFVAWLALLAVLGREALGGRRKVRVRVLDAALLVLVLAYLLARMLILIG
ncbi:MAG: hypothetical protein GXO09_00490 [Crenarchaeota archaeon]|nr:hypothetical protein [Thermoproteota archaeon]